MSSREVSSWASSSCVDGSISEPSLDSRRLCSGPKCSPRQPLSPRQRLYHSKRCRQDARNSRRNESPHARAENAAAVQRHRERIRLSDPLRRYLSDATREIVRAYAQAGSSISRASAMRIVRIVEREVIEPALVRKRIRALVRRARKDAEGKRSGRTRHGCCGKTDSWTDTRHGARTISKTEERS